ncbi:unnamed protein product [Rotaria sp. Silwood1]|nr:unnamed protein product [Rotaria sp. Silwood1]CAF1581361.1 unnamed protein product [Rotaria sp. Silwood1]
MDLSKGSVETLIICGSLTRSTRKFNEQTSMEEVNEYVSHEFYSSLPQSYQIVVYDTTTMSFVDLETLLRNRLNPFQTTSSIDIDNIEKIQHDQSLSNDSYENLSMDDIRNETNCFINSIATGDDVSQDNNEDLSQMTGALSYIVFFVVDLLGLSLTTTPAVIQHSQIHNLLSNRLYFSLDVKPFQRNIYKSDEFSIRADKTNGRIARIQGIKTNKEKMRQILPRIRIPSNAFQSNVKLRIIVVLEAIDNDKRIWYKHPDKGFLPDQYTKDTNPINPIEFNLNKNNLTNDEDFILSLQMITKWNKSKKDFEIIHQLDEKNVVQLHSAIHDSCSPRLLCVLVRDNSPDWNTICLSDFIRLPPKSVRQRSLSVVTERTYSPQRKRAKVNDFFNVLLHIYI